MKILANKLTAFIAILLGVGTLQTQPAQALMIDFSHTATGRITGNLDGIPFSVGTVTFEGWADTDNVVDLGSVSSLEHDGAAISIPGIGILALTTPTRTFVNNSANLVGWSRAIEGTDLLNGPADAIFSAYDLTSDVGPVAGAGRFLQWLAPNVETDMGTLFFDNQDVDVAFAADLKDSVPVPTPALLPGLIGFGMSALRKKRKSMQAA